MKENYRDKLNGLANKLKTEKPRLPIQEISPVRGNEKIKNEESQLSVWIPALLYKDMKRFALENDLSIKDTIIKAIDHFLKQNNRNL